MILALLGQLPAAAPLGTAGPTSHFSDPVVIAMIGGQIVLVIAAIVQGILAIITHLRVTAVKDQQAANTASIGTLARDTEAIKGHVNSEKTASEGRETALRQENVLLREMLTDKATTASLLAQAVATRTREIGAPAGVVQVAQHEPVRVEVVNTPLETTTEKKHD